MKTPNDGNKGEGSVNGVSPIKARFLICRTYKNGRYGYGMKEAHYKSAELRDRLMLMVVVCYQLLVILGQEGEAIGKVAALWGSKK